MKKEYSGGFDIFWTLFVVFLVLKLTGLVDWSWWLVTSPLWIPLGGVLVILLILLIAGVFAGVFKNDTDDDDGD